MGTSTLPDSEIGALVDRVRLTYDDGCFACGRDNPMGLHLDGFSVAGSVVTASFEPRPQFRGTLTTLHGGITATALDEMLVWAAILTHGVMAVTGTLDLRFRKPTKMGQSLSVQARVDERRGKRLRCSGEMLDDDGQVLAEATGLYIATADISSLLA
jgi:acyl-coenzyme A thioesterase PaaI-like protein